MSKEYRREIEHAVQAMVSEGGPVQSDLDQPDVRTVFEPYENSFPSPSELKAFEQYFLETEYNPELLEQMLMEHALKTGLRYYSGHLQGLLGEVFLDAAIGQIVEKTPGIERFPDTLRVGDYEIMRRGLGYELMHHTITAKGKPATKLIDEFDGMLQIKLHTGEQMPVVIESKINAINWEKGGLNSAINPRGVKVHTSLIQQLLGPVGYCVVGAKDRISDKIQLQQRFRENGGILLAYPFTVSEAGNISQRVDQVLQLRNQTETVS